MLKYKILLFLIFFLIFQPLKLKAEEYPRLANYYLKWFISEQEADQLAKWDFLILDMENQKNNPLILKYIREKNPKIKILAYVPSEEVTNSVWIERQIWSQMRNKLYAGIQDSWWLRDSEKNHVVYWHYPDAWMLNMATDWNIYLADFIHKEVMSSGLWDGIFYDVIFDEISWLNNNDIDINKDGVKDDAIAINNSWREGVIELFEKTRKKIVDKVIVINGSSFDSYQPDINGRMFETFPTPWEGNGKWEATMEQYLEKLPKKNIKPNIYILNSNTNNTGKMDNYRIIRFGLSSAFLGNGYFSFDSGDQSHAQIWWYDEYDIKLGKAKSSAYNLLDKNDKIIKPGLWRRDFSDGIAVVNSTDKEQKYVFYREEFEKINGSQDRRVNNGSKVNWVKIASNDGIILLKINTEIENSVFKNGYFNRVFNSKGKQARNGFFSYNDNFHGNVQILISDIDNDKDSEILVNEKGMIDIYDNGVKIISFAPYGVLFKDEISFVVADMNNDGINEIITAPASNGGSHIKIFTKDGKQLTPGWFAYDKNFRGGVSIAVADMNNDGINEIITAPASNGGPHIKIFTKDGKLLEHFFAFEKSFRSKIKIMANDINNDGNSEILVSAESFMN